jgi:hypothetical protein
VAGSILPSEGGCLTVFCAFIREQRCTGKKATSDARYTARDVISKVTPCFASQLPALIGCQTIPGATLVANHGIVHWPVRWRGRVKVFAAGWSLWRARMPKYASFAIAGLHRLR